MATATPPDVPRERLIAGAERRRPRPRPEVVQQIPQPDPFYVHTRNRVRRRFHYVLRTGRRLVSQLRQAVRGEPPPRAFVTQLLTPTGRRRQALARALVEYLPFDDGWQLVGVEVAPIQILIEHTSSFRLTIDLLPRRVQAPAYARTQHFDIRYRVDPPGELSGFQRAYVDRVVEGICVAERELRNEDGFPEVMLAARGAAVWVNPGSHNVDLRPTLACNHHCGFCNSVDRSATDNVMRGVGDIVDSIDDWASAAIETVTISGGEPTLLRDLPVLVSVLADRGFRVELQTNGMALRDHAYTTWLRQSGLDTVLVSLHAADPELSDRQITRLPGAWAQTVAGIDQALAHGLKVDISHVIHRANYPHTRRFFEFVHRRWGRRVKVRLAFVAPTGAAGDAVSTYIPPLPEVMPHLHRALQYAGDKQLRVDLVAYCGIPPCLLAPYHRFSEVTTLRRTEYPDNHQKLPACSGCRYEAACPGVWEGYLRVHGDPGLRAMAREQSRYLRR